MSSANAFKLDWSQIVSFGKELIRFNFYYTILITPEENAFGNSVNPLPNKPWFLRACNKNLLKTLRVKEKLLVTSNSPFPAVFSNRFRGLSANSIKSEIVICKLFQFGGV